MSLLHKVLLWLLLFLDVLPLRPHSTLLSVKPFSVLNGPGLSSTSLELLGRSGEWCTWGILKELCQGLQATQSVPKNHYLWQIDFLNRLEQISCYSHDSIMLTPLQGKKIPCVGEDGNGSEWCQDTQVSGAMHGSGKLLGMSTHMTHPSCGSKCI